MHTKIRFRPVNKAGGIDKQIAIANKLYLLCPPLSNTFLWIEPKLKGNTSMRLNGAYKPTNIEPISLLEAPLHLGFTKSRNHSAMAVFKLKFHGWRLGPYPQDSQVVNNPPFSNLLLSPTKGFKPSWLYLTIMAPTQAIFANTCLGPD